MKGKCESCGQDRNHSPCTASDHTAYYIYKLRQNRKDMKRLRDKQRLEVLQHYSDGYAKCKCCGETTLIFLTIHHENLDGAAHRRMLYETQGKSGQALYRWIRQNNYPSGFSVLCLNCNWAKSHGGCPHENRFG